MPTLYHGTSKEFSKTILEQGFQPGTYFGRHLEDALHFGGPVIFEVWLDEYPTDNWQWRCPTWVPVTTIVLVYTTSPQVLLKNEFLNKRIKAKILEEEKGPSYTLCLRCAGRGQLEVLKPFTYWRDKRKITVCPECKGHGHAQKVIDKVQAGR